MRSWVLAGERRYKGDYSRDEFLVFIRGNVDRLPAPAKMSHNVPIIYKYITSRYYASGYHSKEGSSGKHLRCLSEKRV